jgi:hypothetical protein
MSKPLFLVLLGAGGCGTRESSERVPAAERVAAPAVIGEASFPREWARVRCEREQQCDAEQFTKHWDNLSNCVETRADQKEFRTDWSDLLCGKYHPTDANHCVESMASMQCDDFDNKEWRNECAQVYGC